MACRKELITGALDVWWAPTGEAFPVVGVTPTGNWLQIGTLGARNYGEEGITLESDVSTNDIRSLESVRPECVVVTEVDMKVTMMLKDMSLAQLRAAFNFNAVTNDAGPPDVNTLDLDIGDDLTVVSILLRSDSKSPDFLTGAMQFEFENCIELASKSITFAKEDAAAAALEFRVLAGSSVFRAQAA